MKINTHGNMWTELKQTCASCSCDFLFMLKDVNERVEYDFISGTGRAYRYIRCPECGAKNVYYDPFAQVVYDDYIERSAAPPSPSHLIYDGGEEGTDIVIYDSENEP